MLMSPRPFLFDTREVGMHLRPQSCTMASSFLKGPCMHHVGTGELLGLMRLEDEVCPLLAHGFESDGSQLW